MGLNYQNLDERTRKYMLEEIEIVIGDGSIYISAYLTDQGKTEWPELLKQAAVNGSDATLALQLPGRLLDKVQRRTPSGGFTMAKVPYTAPETMAEGEFNRFYVRAICRRAIDDGITSVIAYRAKEVAVPRPESQAKIGQTFDPKVILEDLRTSAGVEPSLGLPPGPNSGLTVKLP